MDRFPDYNRLHTPIWLFDLDRYELIDCNQAALRFWCSPSKDALRKRMRDEPPSALARQRLANYRDRFRRGETLEEAWTLYPRGEPVSVSCRCSGWRLEDDGLAMLVEAGCTLDGVDGPRLRSMNALDATPMMIGIFDRDGHPMHTNAAAERSFGRDSNLLERVTSSEHRSRVAQALQQWRTMALDIEVTTATGPAQHHVTLTPSYDPDTGDRVIIVSEIDVTARNTAEAELATASRRLEALLDNLSGAVMFEDEDRRLVVSNAAFCELFGLNHSPQALKGLDCRDAAREVSGLFSAPEAFVERIETLVRERRPALDEDLRTVDGRTLQRAYTPVFTGTEYRGHLWQYWDVTDRKRSEQELHSLVGTDPLTGVLNRRAILAALRRERSRCGHNDPPLSILLIDVDHFKRINDTHGHAAGDRVLEQIAYRLDTALGGRERLGRIGGEEFLAVLPDTDPRGARRAAEQLRSQLGDTPVDVDGQALRVTVSVGVATAQADGIDNEALIASADHAMYAAKRAGRNCVASP